MAAFGRTSVKIKFVTSHSGVDERIGSQANRGESAPAARRTLTGAAAALLAASLLTAIIVAANTFLNPLHRSTADFFWAGFYLLSIAAALGLWRLGQNRLLFRLTAVLSAGLLLVVIFFSDNGPALLALAWLLVLAAAIGRKLMGWLRLPFTLARFGESLIFSTGLGMVTLALLTLALASALPLGSALPLPARLTHLLHPLVVYAALILLTAVFVPGFLRAVRPGLSGGAASLRSLWRTGEPGGAPVTLALLAVFGVAGFLLALTPTIRFDALTYHLAVPARYIEARGMVPIPEMWNSYWAHYAEILYTLALIVAGQPLPSLLHYTFGLLSTALVFLLGRRLAGTGVGAAAALLFFSVPVVNFEMGTAYIDLFHAFYTLCAVYAIVLWWQERKDNWLLLAGVAAGFALGVKISAATIVAPMIAILTVLLASGTRSLPRTVSGLLRFGLPALLLLSVWLVRDYAWTGNPIFPMYNGIFNSPLWDNSAPMFSLDSSQVTGPLDVLLMPLDMVIHTRSYYWEAQNGMLAALPLLALPWLYAWHPAIKKETRRYAVALALLVGAACVLFLFTSQNARYMMPLYGLMAVLAALNFQALYEIFFVQRASRAVVIAAVALAGVYFFSTRLALTVRSVDIEERYPVAAALGFETAESFLSRSLPVYDTYQYLNRTAGESKVLAVGTEYVHYADAPVYPLTASIATGELLSAASSPLDLQRILSDNQFEYLVIDWNGVSRFNQWGLPAVQKDFLEPYALLEYARKNVYAYRISGPGSAASVEAGENLLSNGEFEQAAQGAGIEGWEISGSPAIELTASSNTAVRVTGSDFVYQEAAVIPGELYTLGYLVQAESPDQKARLQIMWRDSDRITLEVSAFEVSAGNTWEWQELSAVAPEGAATARVYVTAAESSQVRVDNAVFTRGIVIDRSNKP